MKKGYAMASNRREQFFQGVQQQIGRYHKSLENSPILCIGIGLAVIFFGLVMTIIDIATTEALVLGTTDKITGVQWGIVTQPYYLVMGTDDLKHIVAYGYAWTIETIQLVFGLVLGHALTKISSVNPRLAKLFAIIGALLIILNGVATYNAAPSANPLMQVLVAVAVGGFAVISLPLGIGLIEVGVGEIF